MPDEDFSCMPQQQLMQPDEIDAIAGIFVSLGVKKIRLTGGEPLVRKDAGKIISAIAKYPVELTLTTNGIMLHKFIDDIKAANVKSLNISLDTLQAEKFLLLTKRDDFDKVKNNIQLMLDNGFHIKLNVVAMKNINDNEIPDFIEWTKRSPIHIRFIEFMPFSGNSWNSAKVFTWQEILAAVGKKYSYYPLHNNQHDTAKKYQVEGHIGTFAIISTMSAPFCSDCNRMRLTADGKMKNCLFSKTETNLLTALRNGIDIVPLIKDCIAGKAEKTGGQFSADFTNIDPLILQNRSMISIGG